MTTTWKLALAAAAIGFAPFTALAQDADTPPAAADTEAIADDTSADVELPPVEVVQKPKSTAAARAKKKAVPVSPIGASTSAGSATASAGSAATSGTPTEGAAGGEYEGAVIEASKIPTTAHTTTAADFAKYGNPEPQEVLQQSVPGLIINDAAGSTFRSQVEYRGYSVGSLTGFPQGFAVYQNGARINEVFGDTVFFDVIPSNAISDISLVTGNPVYGLNAVGGGISILMKDGFNYQGTEIDVMGGTNKRRQVSIQHGAMFENASTYLAYEKILDDGYRDFSKVNIDRFYGDIGLRGSVVEMHFNLTMAKSSAGVIAASPVELLEIDRNLTFTSPQTTDIELIMPQINASVKATNTLTLSGMAYYRRFRSDVVDGNGLEGEECEEVVDEDGDGFTDDDLVDTGGGAIPAGTAVNAALFTALGVGSGENVCSEEIEDGEVQALRDIDGNTIEGDDVGEPFGVIDRITQEAESWGTTVQAVEKARILGFKNQFLAGVSYDRGNVSFKTSSELGQIGNKFVVDGSGFFINSPDDFAPRNVDVTTEYVGLYLSDTIELTDKLALTFGGRYNYAMIDLVDVNGNFPDITSNHKFEAFNPNVGATYEFAPGLIVFGSYAESNRAPTPGELACANPDNPCPVESFLTDDPPLDQVLTETYEAGVKGTLVSPSGDQRFQYSVGWFRSLNTNDIMFTSSPTTGRGFFLNAGDTLRQGVEVGLKYKGGPWELYGNYAYVRATFEDSNEFSSPSNPENVPCVGDPDEGCVNVVPGDRLPGIPEHRFKAGVFYDVTPAWTVGATLVAASDQFFLGDEGNDTTPLPGYTRIDLHTSYKLNKNVEFYAFANNVFDREYGLFGTFFEADESSEVVEDGGIAPLTSFSNPQTILPAPPVSVYGGVKVKF